jgi:iron complex outermembrane receptor protein
MFLPVLCALFLACALAAQAAGQTGKAPESAPQQTSAQTPPPAQTPAPPASPIQPVTTTVLVQARVGDDYLPAEATVGNLTRLPLASAPVSATVVTRDLMSDQFSRVLSDVVKNDASIGEDYAPVGYYGDFAIRGFNIDLATGLQVNGLTIAGEQDVQLENKQSVEFLKGIASIDSGVASAGGLIDYVTKRPALVKALEFATDHRGGSYGTMDLGTVFGARKEFGARLNLTGEDIHAYVDDANGVRGAAAFAGDWRLSPRSILKGDFEYQHKVEHSVCGYQLLGGTMTPDLSRVYPSTMLGEQPWSKPNTFDTLNTSVRLDTDLSRGASQDGWRAFESAGLSRSLIDDNVIYAYGCYYEAECNVPGGPPPYFFAPDGTYDIYDYRDPGELRIDGQAEAVVEGRVKTGKVANDLAVGAEVFRRSVSLPGNPPPGTSSSVQDGAVYAYVGSENIYQSNVVVPDSTANLFAGPVQLNEDNHQTAFLVEDRLELPGRVQLIAGGRLDSLRDHNWGQPNPSPPPPNVELVTDKLLWLPQYAATWSPRASLMFYGNYEVLLSLGPQAPFWAGGYYLAPFFSRQAETGVKFEPGKRVLLTAAYFHMRSPFFYPKVTDAEGDQSFVSEGRETHDGVELGAQGRMANWLRVSASVAGIRAISSDTGTLAFDGKQVINEPRWKTAVTGDWLVPRRLPLHLDGLHLLTGWSYSASKEATRDDRVSVPGYNLFNLGARYVVGGEQGHVSFRLYADNVLDKRYWKDTGASYGDTFVHLGAPATVRASVHYQF